MDRRFRFRIGLVGFLVLSGCTSSRFDRSWQRPSPLTTGFQSFKPRHAGAGEGALEPTGVITLRDALAAALLRSPNLAVHAWEVRAREAHALQSGLYFNPEIELEVEEFAGSGERTGFQAAQTTVRISQLIDLGRVRAKRRAVANREARLAGWDYEVAKLRVFTLTTAAFVDVVGAQEQARLATEMLRLAEEVHEAVTARASAGKVSPLEETKAGVGVAQARLDLDRRAANLEVARTRLAAQWGATVANYERADAALPVMAVVPPYAELVTMINQSPSVARWREVMAQREAMIRLEKARRIPTLGVSAGAQRFEESSDLALVAGVSIDVPLFDRNQGGIAEARSLLMQAQAERQAAVTLAETGLREAHTRLAFAARAALMLEREVIPAARQVFDASKTAYALGKLGLIDLLDARRTVVEVEMRRIEARADYHKAVAEVEGLLGQAMPAANKEGGSK